LAGHERGLNVKARLTHVAAISKNRSLIVNRNDMDFRSEDIANKSRSAIRQIAADGKMMRCRSNERSI